MPKSPKSKKLVAQFEYPMRVEIRRGEFEPLDTIGLLDVNKLSQGSHKLCVGYVRGGCCPANTYATVRAGKVIDVTVEACKERQKLTKEAKAIVKEVERRGHIQKRAKWTPVPVKDVYLLQGSGARGSLATLYFDRESGLLVRIIRHTPSKIGKVPTQVDYEDYRDVAGVKFPHRWTVTWLDGRDTFEFTDVTFNAPIDAAKFGEPLTSTAR